MTLDKCDSQKLRQPFSAVSNLSHCRTFVRQTGQNVRQAIFKYDPFFWQFEEKITEVSPKEYIWFIY